MEILTTYRADDRVWRIESREESMVVGGAFVSIKNNTVSIGYITSRKEGVGKVLLKEIIEFAKEHKCTEIQGKFLPVPESYNAALALYRGLGFAVDTKKETIKLSLDTEYN